MAVTNYNGNPLAWSVEYPGKIVCSRDFILEYSKTFPRKRKKAFRRIANMVPSGFIEFFKK